MYFLVNPTNAEKSEGTPDSVDWEFAQKEIAQAKGFATGFGSGLSKGSLVLSSLIQCFPLNSKSGRSMLTLWKEGI